MSKDELVKLITLLSLKAMCLWSHILVPAQMCGIIYSFLAEHRDYRRCSSPGPSATFTAIRQVDEMSGLKRPAM